MPRWRCLKEPWIGSTSMTVWMPHLSVLSKKFQLSSLSLNFHQETLTDEFLTAFCIADLQSRGSGTTGGYGAALNFQNRPNAHGGANNLHSVGVGNAQTTLQPRTNTHQKFSGRINAAPLPVCLSLPILVDHVWIIAFRAITLISKSSCVV